MKQNSVLRQEAWGSLDNKWMTSALFVFVYSCVSGVASAILNFIPGIGSLASALLVAPLGYGLMVGFLRQFRGEEQQIGMLFDGYNKRIWVTMILQLVYTVLWLLLLIIPGIVKSYSYAMTAFILRDYPEASGDKAIEMSMALMQGKKLKLFLLDLSFIGWYILGIIALGIGVFWVMPYHYSARVAFYEDIKAEMLATVG